MKFKKATRIGDNVSDIMKLRCVSYVTKNPDYGVGYHYCMYPGLLHEYKNGISNRYIGHKGDWICEDYNGEWYILTDEEYQRNMEREAV